MSSIKISKEEGVILFSALENCTIKGKDSVHVAPLLIKLDKHLTKLIQKEGNPDLKVASMANR